MKQDANQATVTLTFITSLNGLLLLVEPSQEASYILTLALKPKLDGILFETILITGGFGKGTEWFQSS